MRNSASRFVGVRKWAIVLLAAALLCPSIGTMRTQAQSQAATSNLPALQLLSQEPITSGATLKKYNWSFMRGSTQANVKTNVIEVDLSNPYVQLSVMTGVDGQFAKRQTTLEMAQKTGAVAGVNGDYFDINAEGAPLGPEIADGRFLSSPSDYKGMYAFAITKSNTPVIDTFAFAGSVTAPTGASYPLAGVNKTYYWKESDKSYSHFDALYIYTDAWGKTDRVNNGSVKHTEMLVENNVVKKIVKDGIIDQIPNANQYVLWASRKAADFVEKNIKVGDVLNVSYHLASTDGSKQYDPNNYKMMIGGHTILVDEGKIAKFSRDVSSLGGNRHRTGIGYSKDGRYVYVITADRSKDSDGLSLKEFQELMIGIGVWKGLNLDGGGSTQMVARPLGEFDVKLANTTEYAVARNIVNSVGVYTTAPAGQIKGLTIKGNTLLFMHEAATFEMKAYDEYYNPVKTDQLSLKWSMSEPIGVFDGNRFIAQKPGQTMLTASVDQAKQSKPIHVVGRDQIAELKFNTPGFILADGNTYALPVVATTVDGEQRTVPAEAIQWELQGFDGDMKDGVLTVQRAPKDDVGRIIARYDGFGTMLTLPGGVDKKWADFDQMTPPVVYQQYPSEVRGAAKVVKGFPGKAATNQSLYMSYNFKEGKGNKAVYAAFGENGMKIEGEPLRIKMDVYGDKSFNWLRAEVTDAKGNLQRIDLNEHIDWFGWRKLDVDLSGYHLAYPITLKRIYIVDPEEGQDEREPIGEVAIDDIQFQYRGELPAQPKATVKLAVNRTTALVNNREEKLDQAPLIVKDHTLLPVRFFVDVMGGQVQWDNKEKKVTVINGDHLAEMWIDQPDLVMDGKRVASEVPPMLKNNRTLLPLRLLTENFGWKVTWDEKTKSIVLE